MPPAEIARLEHLRVPILPVFDLHVSQGRNTKILIISKWQAVKKILLVSESSESRERKRKLTKEETDARLAHRHGKHFKDENDGK